MHRFIIALSLLSFSLLADAQISPNGKIRVAVDGNALSVEYKAGKEWQKIMTMPTEYRTQSSVMKEKVSYNMVVGKHLQCSNEYTASVYENEDNSDIKLKVRVYNDGVAWSGIHDYSVDFSSAKNNWIEQWTDSYEGFFPLNRTVKSGERFGYPALFEYKNGVYALLSESCLDKSNAASSMYAEGEGLKFSIRPDGQEQGGWQTLIIGSMSDVVESTLITDNSAPCRLADTSWIESGVASWIYWAYNHGSNDFSIIKKYVDMAVELNLPYVLIDAEWDEMDKIAANEGKTIEDAVRYANEKGIKPIIWYNSSVGWINGAPGPKFRLNKPEDREKEFAWCEKIGVKGVKIDFFSGDTNLNIKYMIELLESAAEHHLLVNFHGATIPRGWQRTYPNLVSTEAVYGAEWYNNVPTFTAKAARHNATLPFTRNVIGSMDYTPCAFTDSQHPHITTHAHELALTALYESGIQHLADRPESFLAQPQQVKDYLAGLSSVWDETKLLAGYPGSYVVMARRRANTWYIAGINGEDYTKTITFDLKRLKKLGKKVMVFEDSGDKASPWKITAANKVPAKFVCQPRGGFLVVIN